MLNYLEMPTSSSAQIGKGIGCTTILYCILFNFCYLNQCEKHQMRCLRRQYQTDVKCVEKTVHNQFKTYGFRYLSICSNTILNNVPSNIKSLVTLRSCIYALTSNYSSSHTKYVLIKPVSI